MSACDARGYTRRAGWALLAASGLWFAGSGACSSDETPPVPVITAGGGQGGAGALAGGMGGAGGQSLGPSPDGHFTQGTEIAARFGVHEIELHGDSQSGNPFATSCTVTFTPNGQGDRAKTVQAFYDGDDAWRARTYVSETGTWTWTSQSSEDASLDGQTGAFVAAEAGLPGMLRAHDQSPTHLRTDDGQTFIQIADTPYRLFTQQALADDYQQFVANDAALGVSSLRCLLLGEWDWDRYWSDGDHDGGAREHPSLTDFQRTDVRLRWMLESQPHMVAQLILFPDGEWSKTVDDTFWQSLTDTVRHRIMDHIIARFGAFPNVFWEVTNDTGLESEAQTPGKWFWATDVGSYFRDHDPWGHLMAYGHTRDEPYPFCSASWSSYIVAYTGYDIACDLPGDMGYFGYDKPIYNTEDYYEEYNPPANPSYFYRRLMWSYLLSGAAATYAGRYDDIVPYAETGLVGLDGVPHIAAFFRDHAVDLAELVPNDALAEQLDPPGPEGNAGPSRPQAARAADGTFVVYVPNATDGEVTGYAASGIDWREQTRAAAALAPTRTPQVRLDLRAASGSFSLLWYRPADGMTAPGDPVSGGDWRTLTSPWQGQDVVLLLRPS